MENNIFENSHFGKLYETKGKKKAVFLDKLELSSDLLSDDEKLVYKLWIEDEDEPYLYNSKGKLWGEAYAQLEDGSVEEYDTDIVSEWDEEIDKDKLQALQAKCLAEDIENGVMKRDMNHYYPKDEQSWIQGYAVGFNKAYHIVKKETL